VLRNNLEIPLSGASMSLLIACILIYQFKMSAWWYAAAVAVFILEVALRSERHKAITDALFRARSERVTAANLDRLLDLLTEEIRKVERRTERLDRLTGEILRKIDPPSN
jgi:hypothetical protein